MFKSSITDVVTETDRAVEAALVSGIRAEYPDHQFIGEKDTAEAKGGNVAPLTGNFSSGRANLVRTHLLNIPVYSSNYIRSEYVNHNFTSLLPYR